MRTTLLRVVILFLLLGTVAPCARSAEEPELPVRCFTQVWNGLFEVVGARYERSTNQLIWVLRAQKDTPARAYEAFLGDDNGVEVATVKVTLAPARASYKAGTQLQAVVPLGRLAPGDVARLTIRKRS